MSKVCSRVQSWRLRTFEPRPPRFKNVRRHFITESLEGAGKRMMIYRLVQIYLLVNFFIVVVAVIVVVFVVIIVVVTVFIVFVAIIVVVVIVVAVVVVVIGVIIVVAVVNVVGNVCPAGLLKEKGPSCILWTSQKLSQCDRML